MYFNSTHWNLHWENNSYCVTGKGMQDYNRSKQEGKEEGQRLQTHGKLLWIFNKCWIARHRPWTHLQPSPIICFLAARWGWDCVRYQYGPLRLNTWPEHYCCLSVARVRGEREQESDNCCQLATMGMITIAMAGLEHPWYCSKLPNSKVAV